MALVRQGLCQRCLRLARRVQVSVLAHQVLEFLLRPAQRICKSLPGVAISSA